MAEYKMTVKQQRFCDEYLISGNASDAARKAGYSEKTAAAMGAENLTKPALKAYIDQRLAAKHVDAIADADEVLRYLTSVVRGESRSHIVVVESIGDYMSEARDVEKAPAENERLKAAELLGRRYGLFRDKVDVSGVQPVLFAGEDDLSD